jgi:hypothetical protein
MYNIITTFTRVRIISKEFWEDVSPEQQVSFIQDELLAFMQTDLKTINPSEYIYQEGDRLLLTSMKLTPIVVNLGYVDSVFDAFRLQIRGDIVNG